MRQRLPLEWRRGSGMTAARPGPGGRESGRGWRRPRPAAPRNDSGRAVSRILSAPKNRGRGSFVLAALPETRPAVRELERAAPRFPIWPCTRRGFPCLADCSASGELLPRLFTLAPPLRAGRFIFCGTLRGHACAGSPRVSPPWRWAPGGVTRHRALWCSDFPPPACDGRKRPSALPESAAL
jgi:hypothetical protein